MDKKRIFLLLFGLSIAINSFALKRKVLFIGNSYIFTNNMPAMLQQLCTSMGDTLNYQQSTPGGQTLQGHSTDPTTLNLINSDKWDIVIIHEQSQRPAFSQGQVMNDTYPYATALYNKVKANNTCSEIMFMMTWGYKNGDASNCAAYPPICTYLGMQDGLRFSYMKMASDNKANIAPVGAAWKVVRDSFSSIDLYSPDNSHPSVSGSYLEACVLYASMFHKSPVTSPYLGGVNSADAAKLKRIAAKVTLDSLEQWQQHGNIAHAIFSITPAGGNSVTFQNQSKRAATYFWDFGDATTSTSASPSKTYALTKNYKVTLTASNACNTDAQFDSVKLIPTSVSALNTNAPTVHNYLNNGKACIKVAVAEPSARLSIYDISGRLVTTHNLNNGVNDLYLDLTTGIYIYHILNDLGSVLNTGKLVQP